MFFSCTNISWPPGGPIDVPRPTESCVQLKNVILFVITVVLTWIYPGIISKGRDIANLSVSLSVLVSGWNTPGKRKIHEATQTIKHSGKERLVHPPFMFMACFALQIFVFVIVLYWSWYYISLYLILKCYRWFKCFAIQFHENFLII